MISKTQIKVCGLRSAEWIFPLLALGIDRLGLVFYPASSRSVPLNDAVAMVHAVRFGRPLVMVTVDMPLDQLLTIYRQIVSRTGRIQLHGHETIDYIRKLRCKLEQEDLPIPEIVHRISSVTERNEYLPEVDKLLWEAPGKMPGGNGILHSWPNRAILEPSDRFIIAGGLTPDNVGNAIRETGAGEVDVSGGVESAPGIKSLDKIKAFINAVRSENRQYKNKIQG